MKATFEVASIEYLRDRTAIKLIMGPMPDGNERGGAEATINIFGGGAVNLLPGQLVTLTIHDRPTPKDRP
jgi:hypothetical protein